MKLSPGILSHSAAPTSSFVAATTYQFAGGGATNWDFSFAGMASGDLALIFIQNTFDVPTPPAGWSNANLGNFGPWPTWLFWKLLNGADIAAGHATCTLVDPAGAGFICAYRGPVAVSPKTTITSAPGDVTLVNTGFVKAGGSKAILAISADRDVPSPFTPPAAWTSRFDFSGTNFAVGLSDLLLPASYVDGSTITLSNFAAGNAQKGNVIELT